jgi:hypothetical protein
MGVRRGPGLLVVAVLSMTGCGQEGTSLTALSDEPSPTPAESPTLPMFTPSPSPDPTPAPTVVPTAVPTPSPEPVGWHRVDEGGFSFELPNDMQREEVDPIDSQVGHFKSDRVFIDYDYGWFSGDYAQKDATDYRDEKTTIDGRPAQISYWRFSGERVEDDFTSHYEYIGGVYFDDVDKTAEATPHPEGHTRTRLGLWVYSHEGWDDARRIVESIRFEGP